MRQTPEMIIMNAYDWNAADRSRVTLPDQMPPGQYDYIANHLPKRRAGGVAGGGEGQTGF